MRARASALPRSPRAPSLTKGCDPAAREPHVVRRLAVLGRSATTTPSCRRGGVRHSPAARAGRHTGARGAVVRHCTPDRAHADERRDSRAGGACRPCRFPTWSWPQPPRQSACCGARGTICPRPCGGRTNAHAGGHAQSDATRPPMGSCGSATVAEVAATEDPQRVLTRAVTAALLTTLWGVAAPYVPCRARARVVCGWMRTLTRMRSCRPKRSSGGVGEWARHLTWSHVRNTTSADYLFAAGATPYVGSGQPVGQHKPTGWRGPCA